MTEQLRLKQLKVLYVEDELDVLEEIVDILELHVGELFTATNGLEAIELFEKENIDIIITDIQMPKMDGLSMVEKIRESNKNIPVIITSAFNEVSYLNQAIDLHVDKYITKPIDMEQLLNVLDRTATVVYQQKEIEQRDRLIKAILDRHPFYSLVVDENNIEKLNFDMLRFLGYENEEDFYYHYNTKGDKCEKYQGIDELIHKITSLKHTNITSEMICLKHKNNKEIEYMVKVDYFEGTHLYLISFFETNKIDNELASCFKHSLCQTCSK
ncbi:MAG: response regulator [Campylobacterota bacterium]|nr:response regulator [Campylobacterota bacterium]